MLIDSDASGLAKAHQDLGGGDHSVYAITGDASDAGTWAQARAGLDGVVPQRLVQCAGIAVSGILRAARWQVDFGSRAGRVRYSTSVSG